MDYKGALRIHFVLRTELMGKSDFIARVIFPAFGSLFMKPPASLREALRVGR
jgi:hypothetical protein